MKKLLFITTRPINPVNSGTKVVLYNYCKYLNEKLNYEIYLYSFYDNENDKKVEQPSFIKEQNFLKQPSNLEKVKNILIYTLLKKWPIQNSVYYSKKEKEYIKKEIQRINPDVIMCDLCRTAEYIKNVTNYGGMKILEMQDLISKRYERQLKYDISSENVYGAYSYKIPNFFKRVLDAINLNKIILKIESKLLKRYEIDSVNYFDKIILVSNKESKIFNSITGGENSVAVQLGVNKDLFNYKYQGSKQNKSIGFVGNMTVAHNRDTISNFIENIFPKVLEKDPDILLKVVGKCDNYIAEKYTSKNINFTGEVDDIKEHVSKCELMIAPLVYGSGIKTKILESMAMGLPVITNKIGAEGIDAISDKHLIIAENSELDKKIIKLLNNKEKLQELAINGKEYVVNNFEWENNLKVLDSLFI